MDINASFEVLNAALHSLDQSCSFSSFDVLLVKHATNFFRDLTMVANFSTSSKRIFYAQKMTSALPELFGSDGIVATLLCKTSSSSAEII